MDTRRKLYMRKYMALYRSGHYVERSSIRSLLIPGALLQKQGGKALRNQDRLEKSMRRLAKKIPSHDPIVFDFQRILFLEEARRMERKIEEGMRREETKIGTLFHFFTPGIERRLVNFHSVLATKSWLVEELWNKCGSFERPAKPRGTAWHEANIILREINQQGGWNIQVCKVVFRFPFDIPDALVLVQKILKIQIGEKVGFSIEPVAPRPLEWVPSLQQVLPETTLFLVPGKLLGFSLQTVPGMTIHHTLSPQENPFAAFPSVVVTLLPADSQLNLFIAGQEAFRAVLDNHATTDGNGNFERASYHF